MQFGKSLYEVTRAVGDLVKGAAEKAGDLAGQAADLTGQVARRTAGLASDAAGKAVDSASGLANVVVGKFRSQDVIDPSCFTRPALKRWESIPSDLRHRLLRNVWCPHCTKQVGITSFTGRMERGDLILSGQCTQCKGAVARLIEGG